MGKFTKECLRVLCLRGLRTAMVGILFTGKEGPSLALDMSWNVN